MSNASQQIDRIRRARCILERMRGRLLRPTLDSLDASAADLNLAVECLRQLDVSSQSPIWQSTTRRQIEIEVVALRRVFRSVEALLRNAGKFYAGLARLLAPDEAPAYYTAGGARATVPHATPGSIALDG